MNVVKNKNFKENHDKLQEDVKKYSNSLIDIYDKMESFYVVIKTLKETFVKGNLYHPFKEIDKIFKSFAEQLNTIIEPIKASVLQKIKDIQKNINEKAKENKEIFNNINFNLEQEEEIIKKKIEFEKGSKNKNSLFNLSKSSNQETDEEIFNEELKASNKQIYKYEIDSIREKIEEKYLNYDKIYCEINEVINNSSEIKVTFYLFSNFVKQFSESLGNFNFQIKSFIQKPNNNNATNDEPKKLNVNPNILNITEDENDFIIISKEEREADEEKIVDKIIQKIIKSENKFKLKQVIDIYNLLGINPNNKKKKNKFEIFLSQISDLCLNNAIFVQNEDNFNHLANILNAIFFQEKSNLNTSKQIIEISKHIQFKNNYLYEIMRKKNRYFGTKNFWTKLIEHELINKINDYIGEKFNNNNSEEKEKESKVNKKIEKDKINLIFKDLNIENNISFNLKKLSKNQLIELNKYIQETTNSILAKYIPSMYQFLLKDDIIHDMFKNYRNILGLNNEIVIHLEDKLTILKLNSKYRNLYHKEKNYQNYKIIFIISQVLKYLPKEEYMKYLNLNKMLKQNLRKVLFTNIFEQNKLSIDLHIKYLGQFLEIYNNKKNQEYKIFKDVTNNSYLKNNEDNKTVTKKTELILNDLKRTIFVQENPNHLEAIKSILLTFCFTVSDIGYYQGFNIFVSFLYQLLNYDEEKTFYFFYSLQLKTNYHLLFKDKFAFLNILFSVFEKIIKLNKPEIFYLLKNINVDLDYFCSSWFTTLFTGNINIINRNDPPLLFIYFIEKFCINGWSAIFNLGLTILEIGYENIKKLEKEELIKYIMKIVNEENIFDNKNYEKCRIIYEKNEKIINETFVDKLIEITKFEYKNKYLIDS